jgi:hypothetical protein
MSVAGDMPSPMIFAALEMSRSIVFKVDAVLLAISSSKTAAGSAERHGRGKREHKKITDIPRITFFM